MRRATDPASRDGAIVVADGDLPTRGALDAAWPDWSADCGFVVAADGGARGAHRLGLRIDLIVGDGDSLAESEIAAFRAAGVEVRLVDAAKDESDTELAVTAALERGAQRLVVLGAFGGPRLDHALANIGLLALPALGDRSCVLLDERTRVSMLSGPGSRDLPGLVGGTVSLLPYTDDVTGVTTSGLAYPLRDEALPAGPARGLSNVRVAATASVSIQHGRLLIVETPATLSG